MAVEQRGVSLGAEAAACSRGPVPGSPYPIQLGFVIGSPGLKDPVHHLTQLNACKMSNQRCVWSLWPRQAPFLQTFTAGLRGPLRWAQDQISVSPHLRFLDQDLFMLLAQMLVPTIHQTCWIFHSSGNAADSNITPSTASWELISVDPLWSLKFLYIEFQTIHLQTLQICNVISFPSSYNIAHCLFTFKIWADELHSC